ncbi:hypothetical protein L798_12673 [Zootermopsis nevadensis]|uniref:Uncharacterized protein n=1 Tax=Zootermopsis nevadensis TaxID=136037 RepID=A0A067QW06_ZOONE|nr:hypothetical protein L798_12673 [Zootermopsis nevadensis]
MVPLPIFFALDQIIKRNSTDAWRWLFLRRSRKLSIHRYELLLKCGCGHRSRGRVCRCNVFYADSRRIPPSDRAISHYRLRDALTATLTQVLLAPRSREVQNTRASDRKKIRK